MTEQEFKDLQIGDRVRHPFGGVGTVTQKDEVGYTVKDRRFNTGDGCDEVSFAWNEGEKNKKINNYGTLDCKK